MTKTDYDRLTDQLADTINAAVHSFRDQATASDHDTWQSALARSTADYAKLEQLVQQADIHQLKAAILGAAAIA